MAEPIPDICRIYDLLVRAESQLSIAVEQGNTLPQGMSTRNELLQEIRGLEAWKDLRLDLVIQLLDMLSKAAGNGDNPASDPKQRDVFYTLLARVIAPLPAH